jgi:hypothetical protein
MCDKEVETSTHIAMSCVFMSEVWFHVLRCFGWQALVPANPPGLASWWVQVRKHVAHTRRRPSTQWWLSLPDQSGSSVTSESFAVPVGSRVS